MDANKQGKGAGVLSDKDKFESGHGSVEEDRVGEQHAKDEVGHMGEKTREARQQHEKSTLQREKK